MVNLIFERAVNVAIHRLQRGDIGIRLRTDAAVQHNDAACARLRSAERVWSGVIQKKFGCLEIV